MLRNRGGGVVHGTTELQRFRNPVLRTLITDCEVNIRTGPTIKQAEMMMSLIMDAMAMMMYVSRCEHADYDHSDGKLDVTWTEK